MMTVTLQWWHWLVIGLALCVCELAIPAFVLIWLGLAAIVLGLLMVVLPLTLTAQLLIWVILSTLLVFLWLHVFRAQDKTTKVGTSDAAIGEVGLLVREVKPYQRGEVMFQRPLMGTDRWACTSDVPLAAGSRVRVIAVEGNTLTVGPV